MSTGVWRECRTLHGGFNVDVYSVTCVMWRNTARDVTSAPPPISGERGLSEIPGENRRRDVECVILVRYEIYIMQKKNLS